MLCGWLLCQGGLPALYAGGGSQPVSLLEQVHAVVLDFENKKILFFSFRENSSGKIFLKCLVARNKGEEVDNNSSYLLC